MRGIFLKMNVFDKINKTVELFKEKRIMVVGDIILDRYSFGEINRLNPEEEGSPLIRVKNDSYTLGGAANVARNIVYLGGKVLLYGLIDGSDFAGKKVKDLCLKEGIDLHHFSDGRSTTVKQRVMSKNRQVARIDREDDSRINNKLSEEILKEIFKEIDSVDGIILSDYNKGLFIEDFAQKIINYANRNNILTFVDTKPDLVNSFKGAYLITPNKYEAEEIVGFKLEIKELFSSHGSVARATRYFVEELNTEVGLITLSEQGIAFYNQKEGYKIIPTYSREVNDVTGAGDTVIAALGLCLVSDLNLVEAVKFSNIAAGVSVSKVGTYAVSKEDVFDYMRHEEFKELYIKD